MADSNFPLKENTDQSVKDLLDEIKEKRKSKECEEIVILINKYIDKMKKKEYLKERDNCSSCSF